MRMVLTGLLSLAVLASCTSVVTPTPAQRSLSTSPPSVAPSASATPLITETLGGGLSFTRPATWYDTQPSVNVVPGPFLWLSSEPLSNPCQITADFPTGCLTGGVLPDGGVLIVFASGATAQPATTPLPLGTFASEGCSGAGGHSVQTHIGDLYVDACLRGPSADAAFDAVVRSLHQNL